MLCSATERILRTSTPYLEVRSQSWPRGLRIWKRHRRGVLRRNRCLRCGGCWARPGHVRLCKVGSAAEHGAGGKPKTVRPSLAKCMGCLLMMGFHPGHGLPPMSVGRSMPNSTGRMAAGNGPDDGVVRHCRPPLPEQHWPPPARFRRHAGKVPHKVDVGPNLDSRSNCPHPCAFRRKSQVQTNNRDPLAPWVVHLTPCGDAAEHPPRSDRTTQATPMSARHPAAPPGSQRPPSGGSGEAATSSRTPAPGQAAVNGASRSQPSHARVPLERPTMVEHTSSATPPGAHAGVQLPMGSGT